MSESDKHVRLFLYSLGHFLVDFSCALLMFSQLSGQREWALCVLLYNFCAFALQMPLGLLADHANWTVRPAALGCWLVAFGWLLPLFPPISAVTMGLGNACFHVGGGIQVLRDGGSNAVPLGIFVSPGAFGVYFGTLLGNHPAFPGWLTAFGLLLFGLIFSLPQLQQDAAPSNHGFPLHFQNRKLPWTVFLLFLVVVLRSYLGMVFSFPWKTSGWTMAMICAVVFGKAAGGFLGDRLGMRSAAILSLGLSAALFLLSGWPPAGTASVFFFNMTMPLTLWAAAQLFPQHKGFAFGTLTFALFLGFLPSWLGWSPLFLSGAGYAAGAVCSLALLVMGLKLGRLS